MGPMKGRHAGRDLGVIHRGWSNRKASHCNVGDETLPYKSKECRADNS